MTENSGEQIIEELRQKLEVHTFLIKDEAQRKSEKLKSEMAVTSPSSKNSTENNQEPRNIFANLEKPQGVSLFGG